MIRRGPTPIRLSRSDLGPFAASYPEMGRKTGFEIYVALNPEAQAFQPGVDCDNVRFADPTLTSAEISSSTAVQGQGNASWSVHLHCGSSVASTSLSIPRQSSLKTRLRQLELRSSMYGQSTTSRVGRSTTRAAERMTHHTSTATETLRNELSPLDQLARDLELLAIPQPASSSKSLSNKTALNERSQISPSISSAILSLSDVTTARPEVVHPQETQPQAPKEQASATSSPIVTTLTTSSVRPQAVDPRGSVQTSGMNGHTAVARVDVRSHRMAHTAARVPVSSENDIAEYMNDIVASHNIMAARRVAGALDTTPPGKDRWEQLLEDNDA